MIIIGITARARSGKDTAAHALKKEMGFELHPIADNLKRACIFKFGLSEDDVFTQAGKDRYVPEYGLTVGEILQQEGTEGTKPHWGEDFWIRRWWMDVVEMMKYDSFEGVVATDCRFDDEAQFIKSKGGKILQIIRPGAEEMIGSRDPNHPSEQGISPDLVDAVIYNDSDIETLRIRVIQQAKEWVNG